MGEGQETARTFLVLRAWFVVRGTCFASGQLGKRRRAEGQVIGRGKTG